MATRGSSRFFSSQRAQRPSGLLDLGLPPSLRFQQQQKQDVPTARSALYTADTNAREYVIYEHRPSYALFTDPMQDDRATEIKLLSLMRPHMRAFHFSWLSFFVAFFAWFSIPALMPTIQAQLNLTEDQVVNSDIVALASATFGSLMVGALCDRYGARSVQAALLVCGAVPVASAAFVFNFTGFVIIRIFIGLIGSSSVVSAYWTSIMFSTEVIGSAIAITAGCGCLGAGAAFGMLPFLLDFASLHNVISDAYAWRVVIIFPAMLMVAVGACVYLIADDCPLGNFTDLKKAHAMAETARGDMWLTFALVVKKPSVLILAFQYACCFGTVLQVQIALSAYYSDDLSSSTQLERCRNYNTTSRSSDCYDEGNLGLAPNQVHLVVCCFGLLCIFARAAGGIISDVLNRRVDMRGRLWAQLCCLVLQGATLYWFSKQNTLIWSIFMLACFGIFSHASAGTTFAIVPYVHPEYVGAASGIVVAGGSLGAMLFTILFKYVATHTAAFQYMSFVVMATSLLTSVIFIDGQRSLLGGSVLRRLSGANPEDELPPPRRIRGFYV